MTHWTIALLWMAALVAGCSKASTDAAPSGEASDRIGIAECDEYIEKMEACLDKIPAEAKAVREAGFKQAREGWKEQAKSEAAKDELKASCKAALDSFNASPPCK